MYTNVAAIIRRFLSLYEGELREMYIDNRGLVTTGVGNLLQTPEEANRYKWEIPGGGPASAPDVAAEYQRVSSPDTKIKIPNWAVMGGGNFINAAKQLKIVTLQLTTDSYAKIFNDKLTGLESTMKGTPGFEEYEKYPADAQLGVLSLIWANGAGAENWGPRKEDLRLHKTWPNFTNACKRRAWSEIADRKHYKWKNIMFDRDKATEQVFRNAQVTEGLLQTGGDATKILYPIP
jgi:hypothetical protein